MISQIIARPSLARHDSSLSDHLSSSQLPVWTIYAEKICVPTTSQIKCEASWAFEMVSGENISKRSERKRERELENWQFLAVEPTGPVNISRIIFFIVTDQTLNTKIATLGQNVSKNVHFSVSTEWSDLWISVTFPDSPHCRSRTPTSPCRRRPAGSARCLSGTWQSAEQSAETNKDLFAGEIQT